MNGRIRDHGEVRALLGLSEGIAAFDAMVTRVAETGALLRGHFLLQSGLHSEVFLRAAQLLYRPAEGRLFAEAMAEAVDAATVDVVVASDAAASFLADPLAELLDKDLALVAIDARRRPTEGFSRGTVEEGARVLVVGDVVTSGTSLEAIAKLVATCGGKVVQTAALAVLAPRWLDGPGRVALLRPTWRPEPAASCAACQRDEALWPAYELA